VGGQALCAAQGDHSLRELYAAGEGEQPAGLFVKLGRIEVYGLARRLAAWDIAERRPLAPEELGASIPIQRGQRLHFSSWLEEPAIAGWIEEQDVGQMLQVESSSALGKRVSIPRTHGLAVVVSADGRRFAAFRRDIHRPLAGELHLGDIETSAVHLDVLRGPIDDVHLSADGARVLVLTPEKLHLLASDGAPIAVYPPARRAWISRDGSLVAALRGGALTIHGRQGELASLRVGPIVREVAFAEQAQLVAAAGDERLALWRIPGGEELASRAAAPGQSFRSIDVEASGARLVAGAIEVEEATTRERAGRGIASVLEWRPRAGWSELSRATVGEWSRDTPSVRLLRGSEEVLVSLPDRVFLLGRDLR